MKAFSTEWARSAAAGAARAALLRVGFAPLLAAKLDVHVEGRELLDQLEPPVLFVANHTSHLDAPLVLTALPAPWRNHIAVGAAADHFFDVWWRAAATALAFNAFPVARGERGRQRGLGRQLLREGWSLLVFPEGTRSRDGVLATFGHGASVLSVESGVPVVPIAISGAYQAMPSGRNWPYGGRPRVTLRFGQACRPASGESAAAFSRRLEARLLGMVEEERTTWWSSLRRRARPAEPKTIAPPAARWRRIWSSSEPLAKDEGPWSASDRPSSREADRGQMDHEDPQAPPPGRR